MTHNASDELINSAPGGKPVAGKIARIARIVKAIRPWQCQMKIWWGWGTRGSLPRQPHSQSGPTRGRTCRQLSHEIAGSTPPAFASCINSIPTATHADEYSGLVRSR